MAGKSHKYSNFQLHCYSQDVCYLVFIIFISFLQRIFEINYKSYRYKVKGTTLKISVITMFVIFKLHPIISTRVYLLFIS